MKALDLCCGAGGASVGLHRAGYEVTGVDIKPQPHYPFGFVQADAREVAEDRAFLQQFALVWASWPCQGFSTITPDKSRHADLITPGRALLEAAGVPYIMENVVGAPLAYSAELCGYMFGLKTPRHRRFESNYLLLAPPHTPHGTRIPRAGRGATADGYISIAGHFSDVAAARAAMGIDWMTRDELAQAIPPVYAEYLARQIGQVTLPSLRLREALS